MTFKTNTERICFTIVISILMASIFLLSGCHKNSTTVPPVIFITETSNTPSAVTIYPASEITLAETEPDKDGVELIDVSFAADGAYIAVYFRAPPELVNEWWQGRVYVIDETTNKVFGEVPVMPVVGPLIAKPKEPGQSGYFMLNNTGGSIKFKSLLTVVLGKYKRVHVVIE